MVRLRILELIEEQGKTKYQVFKQLGMSYGNFDRMIKNRTKAIRFETVTSLCVIFNCEPGDLFTQEEAPPVEPAKKTPKKTTKPSSA